MVVPSKYTNQLTNGFLPLRILILAAKKELTQVCKQGNVTIDDVFRYYSPVFRGRNKDKSKEVGLRKFYSENNYEKLKNESLITEMLQLANFWRYLDVGVLPDNDINYVVSEEAKKQIHCLNCYPNDFWKYAKCFLLTK